MFLDIFLTVVCSVLDFFQKKGRNIQLGQQGYKILIVDDEENTRIGLQKLLSAEGYEVETVANGFQALEFLRL